MNRTRFKLSLVLFFVATYIIYFFTSAGTTPYDYFTRLADAFIAGRYWLTEKPGWLTELIPWSQNINFVPYAPMPAVAALPFRFIFGEKFEQQFLAHIFGAGIGILTILNAYLITKSRKVSYWIGAVACFGTVIWYLSATGSSWYLGQVASAFFLSGAVYTALSSKSPFTTGVLVGAAALCRLHVIFALPFFLYSYFDKSKWLKNYTLLVAGIAPFGVFNFLYNYVRFGTIFDQAYFLLPKTLNELDAPWFKYGVFNYRYIINNLETMFLALPRVTNKVPFVSPSWNGLAIWITTPAFIYSLLAPVKNRATWFIWMSILPIALVVISHGGNGFAQFGYRFAVDFYPFLFILMALAMKNKVLRWHHWILLGFSVLVNLWGVLWINKFGWVGY